jgi:hypothetical protein
VKSTLDLPIQMLRFTEDAVREGATERTIRNP